jgi:hypothetical protein
VVPSWCIPRRHRDATVHIYIHTYIHTYICMYIFAPWRTLHGCLHRGARPKPMPEHMCTPAPWRTRGAATAPLVAAAYGDRLAALARHECPGSGPSSRGSGGRCPIKPPSPPESLPPRPGAWPGRNRLAAGPVSCGPPGPHFAVRARFPFRSTSPPASRAGCSAASSQTVSEESSGPAVRLLAAVRLPAGAGRSRDARVGPSSLPSSVPAAAERAASGSDAGGKPVRRGRAGSGSEVAGRGLAAIMTTAWTSSGQEGCGSSLTMS